ncbi:MAG: hypothetical protein GYB64_10855 [Chloroflexi bacterium]|nr:hypothetical protein [Chloroflexota bacterium]
MPPRRKHFREHTLHTGPVAYLLARGLVGLEYPVLVTPLQEQYKAYYVRRPHSDRTGLFYRIWEPNVAMRLVATDVLRTLYEDKAPPDESGIWKALKRIQQRASVVDARQRRTMRREIMLAANQASENSGEVVLPASLMAAAMLYRQTGLLVLPDALTASVVAASLLLMIGVPRDQVAVFGMYYQDPTSHSRRRVEWRAGFLAGSPHYVTMGVVFKEEWTLVDLTAPEPLPEAPADHLRSADLGRDPRHNVVRQIDYAHPYTMVFAPAPPHEDRASARLSHIPLLGRLKPNR